MHSRPTAGWPRQARDAKQTLAEKVEQQPLISLLVAGGIAYALAIDLPARD